MKTYSIPEDMKAELNELIRQADKHLGEYEPDFECAERCSACCETFHWNLIEVANLQEKKRFKSVLKVLRKRIKSYNVEFHCRIRRQHIDVTDLENFADAFKDMRCVFLFDNRCLVYEDRPLLCRLTSSRNSRRCVGNLSLPPEYEEKASSLLMQVFYLNVKFSKVHFPGKTVMGFPFRFLV